MTNRYEPIMEFILQNEEGEITYELSQIPLLDGDGNHVLNEDGEVTYTTVQGYPLLVAIPITKDIGALVSKGKAANLDSFATLQIEAEQVRWAYEFLDYLKEYDSVEEYNNSLPEPYEDEEGNTIAPEPKAYPQAPTRPSIKTVEEVLAPYARRTGKLKGILFKGVNVALSETNQNGLSSLNSALTLATEFNLQDKFFPIHFNAETAEGNKTVELLDVHELKEFGLQFMLARKEYFE